MLSQRPYTLESRRRILARKWLRFNASGNKNRTNINTMPRSCYIPEVDSGDYFRIRPGAGGEPIALDGYRI